MAGCHKSRGKYIVTEELLIAKRTVETILNIDRQKEQEKEKEKEEKKNFR